MSQMEEEKYPVCFFDEGKIYAVSKTETRPVTTLAQQLQVQKGVQAS